MTISPGPAPLLADPADSANTIIVTAANAVHFEFGRELVLSIEASRPGPVAIGFYDLGLAADQIEWLLRRGVIVRRPRSALVPEAAEAGWGWQMGCLARPFLPENFPGFDVYVWLDADAWVQDWAAVRALAGAALANGAAMVRQDERAYRFWPWLLAWQLKHSVLGYGVLAGAWLATRPHISDGVFAMRADAPHWQIWRRRFAQAFSRTGQAAPHDQFSLNAAVYLDRLATAFLPATCNWICDLATPMWNAPERRFCVPYAPFASIGVLHLAGPAKTARFEIKGTDGSSRRQGLRFGQGVFVMGEAAPPAPAA